MQITTVPVPSTSSEFLILVPHPYLLLLNSLFCTLFTHIILNNVASRHRNKNSRQWQTY